MCTISFVGDSFRDHWTQPGPYTVPVVPQTVPTIVVQAPVSRQEFDALKREVELMHDLLRAAKKYDEDNGEPDCETDEKVAVLKKVAELVGVDLSDVFGA